MSSQGFPLVQMNSFLGKKICAKRISNHNYLNQTGSKKCNEGEFQILVPQDEDCPIT